MPRDLEVICLKCLEKDPRRRYASADALAEDLKHWLAGEPIAARPVGNAARLWMWCRRNPVLSAAAGLVAASLVIVAALSMLYADRKTRLATTERLCANEQTQHALELAQDAATISAQAVDLKKQSQKLETSLADSNRRLAMLFFERAQRAFDGGQVNHGLLWLVECWRFAALADDHAWQHLARANLTFWRYHHLGLKGKFSQGYVSRDSFSPDGKTILTQVDGRTARLWSTTTDRPIGQPMNHPDILGIVLKFSPDGKTVLTYSLDHALRLWDATVGTPVGQPMPSQDTDYIPTYSPDGKTVVAVTSDGTVRLWNVSTGRQIGNSMKHRGPLHSDAISRDGRIVLCNGREASLWIAATGVPSGKPLRHQNDVRAAVFSPDGKFVATGSADKTARLWDASTGLPVGAPMVHRNGVGTVAFSPDGKTLLTASFDSSGRLWDTATGLPKGAPLEHEGSVKSALGIKVSFSPDGKTFLIRPATQNIVRLGDAASGMPIGRPLEHHGAVLDAAFSSDGKMVLTASRDRLNRLWDAATGQPLGNPIAHESVVESLAFSTDGKSVLTASTSGGAWLSDISTGLPLGQPLDFSGEPACAAFSPDGTTLLTLVAHDGARLWDARTGLPIGRPMNAVSLGTAVFSRDGKTILTGSFTNSVRLWNAATGEPMAQPIRLDDAGATANSGQPKSRAQTQRTVTFSPDGTLFLAINHAGTALLWNRASSSLIMQDADVDCAAFSPDGKVVATGSREKAIRLWETSTGKSIGAPLKHVGQVVSVTFSPDGKTIATASRDRTAQLWNTDSRQPIGPPLVLQEWADSIAFSPDGKTVLTSGRNIRLWNASTTQAIGQRLLSIDGARFLAFSPDGKTILAGSSGNGARLWDVATRRPIGPELKHEGSVDYGAYSPDGKAIVTASTSVSSVHGTVRLWRLPTLIDADLGRAKEWVETITGFEVDGEGNIKALETEAWQERHDRLRALGGPPRVDSGWLFDPILYGADPNVRGRAWVDRKCWAEAEAELTKVVQARPLRSTGWLERGRFYSMRSDPEKALADFVAAFAVGNRDPKLVSDIVANDERFDRALALLPGDSDVLSVELLFRRAAHLGRQNRFDEARAVLVRAGAVPWEEAEGWGLWPAPGKLLALLGCSDRISALLRDYQQTPDSSKANEVAWYCVLAPGAVAEPDVPVRLAELAVKGFSAEQKHTALNTLGAALFRAGRFADAIRRLEEGIKLRNGADEPFGWPFLAMAHHRLGHRDEARGWLDRLRNRRPSTNSNQFWNELEIGLLRSEAEAVILFDPIFPADPFAH